MALQPKKDLITADDVNADLCCSVDGMEHDYRPFIKAPSYPGGEVHTYNRCVWCHAVSCGNYDDPDPCIEPYHHRTSHRTALGVMWPLGGNRPGVVA